jgi:alkylhydroperoxidase family enzyme
LLNTMRLQMYSNQKHRIGGLQMMADLPEAQAVAVAVATVAEAVVEEMAAADVADAVAAINANFLVRNQAFDEIRESHLNYDAILLRLL